MKPKIQEDDFYTGINQAISEGRHVDYLQEVVKKYEQYTDVFEDNFTEGNQKNAIYTFRATYILKKPVWRNIEILGEQTFLDLAEQIISSMDWDNDHMHGFEFPGYRAKPDPLYTGSSLTFFAPGWEDDPHPTFKTNQIHLYDIDYGKQPKLRFTFDYGDGHEFDVVFKGTRILDVKEKKTDFPRIVDQRGVAPEQYPEIDE